MGKGSSSGKNTAIKQARVSSTGAGAGGSTEGEAANLCLFQFQERLQVPEIGGVKVGDTVALVPNSTNTSKLDIYIGAARFGQYAGQHLARLLQCISQKFSYTGTVQSVTPQGAGYTVAYVIQGHSYEQSSTTL